MKKYSEKASEAAITPLRGASVKEGFRECTVFYPLTKWLSGGFGEVQSFFAKNGIDARAESFAIQIQSEEGAQLAIKSKTDWNIVIVTNPGFHEGQMRLIRELIRKRKKVAVICGSFPYEQFPEEVRNVVAAYWTWPAALKAAFQGLLGERKMKGVLPFR